VVTSSFRKTVETELDLGCNRLRLFTSHHVNDFPWTILRAELATDADLFIHNNDAVYTNVAMLLRVLWTRDFVQTIHWTEFDANFTASATFFVHYSNELCLLLSFRWSGYNFLDCLSGKGTGGADWFCHSFDS
jgi:hypothetical protein